MNMSLLDRAGRPRKVVCGDQRPQITIDEVASHYDLIGMNYTNEIDCLDRASIHSGKNDLIELQQFAQSSTKPTLAQIEGDEEPFNDICNYLNNR